MSGQHHISVYYLMNYKYFTHAFSLRSAYAPDENFILYSQLIFASAYVEVQVSNTSWGLMVSTEFLFNKLNFWSLKKMNPEKTLLFVS